VNGHVTLVALVNNDACAPILGVGDHAGTKLGIVLFVYFALGALCTEAATPTRQSSRKPKLAVAIGIAGHPEK
jgi:hypothetical protein